MREPIEITREQANEVIMDSLKKNYPGRSTLCYQGRWYDMRGLNYEEVEAFITKLFGRVIPKSERKDINIKI